eukprot:3847629-Pleurochrysis_carterae.AAC.1
MPCRIERVEAATRRRRRGCPLRGVGSTCARSLPGGALGCAYTMCRQSARRARRGGVFAMCFPLPSPASYRNDAGCAQPSTSASRSTPRALPTHSIKARPVTGPVTDFTFVTAAGAL